MCSFIFSPIYVSLINQFSIQFLGKLTKRDCWLHDKDGCQDTKYQTWKSNHRVFDKNSNFNSILGYESLEYSSLYLILDDFSLCKTEACFIWGYCRRIVIECVGYIFYLARSLFTSYQWGICCWAYISFNNCKCNLTILLFIEVSYLVDKLRCEYVECHFY